jgi:hypothetical protein
MWEIYAYQNADSLFGIFNAVATIHGSGDYMRSSRVSRPDGRQSAAAKVPGAPPAHIEQWSRHACRRGPCSRRTPP